MKFLVAPRAGVVINALPCGCNGINQCGSQSICGTQCGAQCVSQSICGTQCASLAICDTRCSSQLVTL